tara:strand:- start:52676 stop:53230 length:555 start_codon:yes stop_codon:yes gene_type:complete
MACNCNSSNCKSTPCACRDTGITTPCAYSQCTGVNVEKCAECLCAECITWCQETIEVKDPSNNIFTIAKGERFSAILQRVALFIKNPATATSSVQYLYIVNKTSTSVTLGWAGVPSSAASLNVKFKVSTSGSYGAAPSGTAISTGLATFTVTGLTPSTVYKFQIDANVGGTMNGSVETYCTTNP